MNHEDGQYRAELFDRFVSLLLRGMFPHAPIVQNAAFSTGGDRNVSIDFVIRAADGDILVETKAPYTKAASDSINRTIERIVFSVESLSKRGPVRAVILAVPVALPKGSLDYVSHAQKMLRRQYDTQFDVWDAPKLSELAHQTLDVGLEDFTVATLETVVGSLKLPSQDYEAPDAKEGILPVGEHQDVLVLSADFCSFTAFVRASDAEAPLIASVMGRFYRETREAIRTSGGILDKYIGDGMLCYWFGAEPDRLELCVARLVGIALNIAEEWQDQIDHAVVPKGLRAGAAIGRVLFVEERPSQVHAIGDSINLAARLQAAADPNALVISNRLRARHFGGRSDFTALGPVTLKNLGDMMAWQKTFVQSADA